MLNGLWLGFFLIAALGVVLALGVVVESVVRNRRTRLANHQSVRRYYGARLALHH